MIPAYKNHSGKIDKMKRNRSLWLSVAGLLLFSCNGEEPADAYGQFEADETVVSAEISGRLLSFNVREGERLEKGAQTGLIDTIRLSLQRREMEAGVDAVESRLAVLDAQRNVHESRLQTARQELERLESLLRENAATRQQLDRASGEVEALSRQVEAVEAEKEFIRAELRRMRVQLEQIDDQLRRAWIVNPVAGTVLARYAEPTELVAPGQPLYRIASLGEMELRVYVSGSMLPAVQLGQKVEVRIDAPDGGLETLQGTVSWVSSRAEFTPRMIQTRVERVTQVYAVRIRVPNPDGRLKIGMPGEVNFAL